MTRTWTPESEHPKPRTGVDYHTVKAWFQQCRDLAAAVEAQRQKIDRIRSIAEKITPSMTGMPGGNGSGDKIGAGASDLVDEKRTLQRMETELCNLRIEAARRAGHLVTNPECAEAICEYYVASKTQEVIAKETGLSGPDVVRRRINRGCKALAEIWEEFEPLQTVQDAQESTA